MLRVALDELRHRRGRTLGLLLGILVATTSFTVLTGTSQTQRLEARGTVAKSFRGDYDVLVRPRGSRSGYERATGEVQPNFLSGRFGGITTAQWRSIQRIPGVEVAAPLANVGYLLPTAKVPVDVSAAAGTHGRALLRARITWRSDRGLTRVRDAPDYVYVTPNPLRREPEEGDLYHSASLREYPPGRRGPIPVCFGAFELAFRVIYGPWTRRNRTGVGCYSRATGTGRSGDFGMLHGAPPQVEVRWAFPLLVTAIDPESEARLTHLDRSLVDGRYLREDDRAHLLPPRGPYHYQPRVLPVLASSRTYVDEQAELTIERLSRAAVNRWTKPFVAFETHTLEPLNFLMHVPAGPVVQRARVPASVAYGRLLRELQPGAAGDFSHYDAQGVQTVWRTGATSYTRHGSALVPATRFLDDKVWQTGLRGGGLIWAHVSPSARDTRLREVTRTQGEGVGDAPNDQAPLLSAVGTFDPDRLGAAPEPGAAPLSTLQAPQLVARNQATAAKLGGAPLRPNGNLGGYLTQPPALLTTLRGARAFGGRHFPTFHPDRGISAVRVRVAGVTGIDALSRERIRQAAERIATRTGLDVDITAGASGAPTAVDLPAGRYGRPRLELSETWVRKGVAARVLTAVDRKSLLLFALILVVCALFVTNAASAAVRARRRELGILASLGWSTWRLFGVVLCEVAIVGLAAGVLGGGLALALAALLGVDASLGRAALAVPAATMLALLSGLVPAARAARADPVAAVRPIVLDAGRGWRPRSLGALALVNLLRAPGRTVLGALSLAIGVCALTLLLAATLAFHDVLVGTLLGDAIGVEVRATDIVAVVATVLLGVAAVADVLFLNLRERAGEFATLGATGWDEWSLGRVIAYEGVWIGALGALTGSGLGLAAAAVFADALPTSLIATTAGAALGGTLLAGAAALAPAAWLRRLPPAALLAED